MDSSQGMSCIYNSSQQNLKLLQLQGPQKKDKSREELLAALKECSRSRDLKWGQAVHLQAIQLGYSSDTCIANTLISMYGKCGSMGKAREVFDSLSLRNLISWNALLQGYADNGDSELVFEMFEAMEAGYAPDGRTFVALLTACNSTRNIGGLTEKGKAIHSRAVMTCCSDIFVENKLIDLYARCGCMVHSRAVFDGMAERDIVSWNTILQGYVENGHGKLAVDLFEAMEDPELGCLPDARTYGAALRGCTAAVVASGNENENANRWLARGKAIYSRAVRSQFCNNFVQSSILVLFAKCGTMEHSRAVFDSIVNPDIIFWNALLHGYVDNEDGELALELFNRMEEQACFPDGLAYAAAVRACAVVARKDGNWIERGKLVHSQAVLNGFCGCALERMLVNMYARCGGMIHARAVFDAMVEADMVAWTSLLQGYVENGNSELAMELFDAEGGYFDADSRTYLAALAACSTLAEIFRQDYRWLEATKSIHSQAAMTNSCNIFVESSLVDVYAKAGSLKHARTVFDNMVDCNVVSWSSLLWGYVEHREFKLGLQLIARMDQSGISQSESSFVAALEICREMMAVELGEEFHAEISRRGLEQSVATNLLEFYIKLGRMELAKQVFDSIGPGRDDSAWHRLLRGYCNQADAARAFKILQRMQEQGVDPNSSTFTFVLGACNHAGLAEESRQQLESMHSEYGIRPNWHHYACIVDLLCRANCLEEALRIVQEMPFAPQAIIWETILGGCVRLGDAEVGIVAFERLKELDAEKAAEYHVSMANIYTYAASGG